MERRIDHYLNTLIDEDRFAFYEAVRDFSDDVVAPNILGWEREHSLVSDEVIAQMGEMGLFGLPIPEEFGGQGGDHNRPGPDGLGLRVSQPIGRHYTGRRGQFGHQTTPFVWQ